MKMIFYAKPDQSYREHVEAVYHAWKEVVKYKKKLICRLASIFSFTEEDFLQGSLLTVVLHDIGKMIEPFQSIMEAKKHNKKVDYRKNYRHELASIAFIFAALNKINENRDITFPFELFAVASHHRRLDTDLTAFEREKLSKLPNFCKNGIKEALQTAEEIFSLENYPFPELDEERLINVNGLKYLIKTISLLPKFIQRENPRKIRVVYSLMKGILHYADWYGSAGISVDYSVENTPEDIISNIKTRCMEKGIIFNGLREFQKSVGSYRGNLIVIAPTGSGKTEASLLWALNNSKDLGSSKIIYLLPTMATANSMWLRLAEIFGSERVGLTHSSSNLMFREEEEKMEFEKEATSTRNMLFDRVFIRPVTVATIDQLLNTGFNSGHWAVKEINAANAVIIMDEIHAYDGWTMGLIFSSIKHYAELGARFLLMSASMPCYLIDLLKECLDDAAVIKDTELLNEQRSTYWVKPYLIDEAYNEIEQAVLSGHKVLVVVNTVDKCQQLTETFKVFNPVCLHSRFILKDRKEIEKNIDNAGFVIATQIVEVSLDIDFDWLFTECAPPDAIVQRAGRVNRYRDPKRDSRVIIYKAGHKSERIYNPLNDKELLERTFRTFNKSPRNMKEKDLLDVIEEVYDDYDIRLSEAFQQARDQFHVCQKNRLCILDNRLTEDELEKTRLSRYETISVIPLCFYNEVKSLPAGERKWYEVKIPYWFARKYARMEDGLLFCDLKYDRNLGAFLKEDQGPLFL